MLKVGDRAPDFQSKTTEGTVVRLSELRGKNVVLFFFPKAFTTGCTIETKQFRDASPDITALGAVVIGISCDRHQTQCDFATSLKATFPMIGDESGSIGKSYGVL